MSITPATARGQRLQRRHQPGFGRSWWRWIAVGLLVSGCVVAVAADSSSASQPIRVTVIGDSLSTGLQTPGDPWTAEAQQLLGAKGDSVEIVNAAENGAGYVARGEYGDDFLAQVNQAVDSRAQIVLVFGSDNDLGLTDLPRAVSATLSRVRALAPFATLVVIGPPAPPAQSAQGLGVIRDALRTGAQNANGQFVDPLSLKWFQGDDTKYVSPDQEHPDNDGELYLARQITTVLTPIIHRLAKA